MFLGISQEVPPDTVITVRFRPAKHLPVVEAKARVCYHRPGEGIGIEFTEIAPEHRQFILRLIHHRMREDRRFPRVPYATQVQHGEGTFIGFSKDISAGGMFVETNQAVEPGTKLNLRFHLDDVGPIVRVEAEVLYEVAQIGIGLRFTDISPEDNARIEAFVSRKEAAAGSKRKP